MSVQLEEFPGVPILGGRDCPHLTKLLADGETFKIGEGVNVKAMHTPCHTQDSICYYVQDGDHRAVFTGDTLFIGGKYGKYSGLGSSLKVWGE